MCNCQNKCRNSNSALSMELTSSFVAIKTPPPHLRRKLARRPISPTVFFSIATSDSTRRATLAQTLQTETLETLEWPSLCKQLSAFTSTTMGFAAAQNGRIPLGRSPEESRKLLDQTAAAVALPGPLDFSGIEDVSHIVDSSVAGQLATVSELCAVKRTLGSAKELFEQLKEHTSQVGESSGR